MQTLWDNSSRLYSSQKAISGGPLGQKQPWQLSVEQQLIDWQDPTVKTWWYSEVGVPTSENKNYIDQYKGPICVNTHVRIWSSPRSKLGGVYSLHCRLRRMPTSDECCWTSTESRTEILCIVERHSVLFMSSPICNHEQLYICQLKRFSSLALRRRPLRTYLLCAYSCFMPNLSSEDEAISAINTLYPFRLVLAMKTYKSQSANCSTTVGAQDPDFPCATC